MSELVSNALGDNPISGQVKRRFKHHALAAPVNKRAGAKKRQRSALAIEAGLAVPLHSSVLAPSDTWSMAWSGARNPWPDRLASLRNTDRAATVSLHSHRMSSLHGQNS
jgi:hypothetical protein